jgi:hypothetical protein
MDISEEENNIWQCREYKTSSTEPSHCSEWAAPYPDTSDQFLINSMKKFCKSSPYAKLEFLSLFCKHRD